MVDFHRLGKLGDEDDDDDDDDDDCHLIHILPSWKRSHITSSWVDDFPFAQLAICLLVPWRVEFSIFGNTAPPKKWDYFRIATRLVGPIAKVTINFMIGGPSQPWGCLDSFSSNAIIFGQTPVKKTPESVVLSFLRTWHLLLMFLPHNTIGS